MAYVNPAAGKRRGDYTEAAVADLAALDVTATVDQTTVNAELAKVRTKLNALLVELRKAGVISS